MPKKPHWNSKKKKFFFLPPSITNAPVAPVYTPGKKAAKIKYSYKTIPPVYTPAKTVAKTKYSFLSPARGNDIFFTPGKGDPGMPDGKIAFNNADGDEVLSINSDNTVTILGENFALKEIKEWLINNFKSGGCTCSLNQLMSRGCSCGGK